MEVKIAGTEALLGCGGEKPRLDALDPATGQTGELLSLRMGHSVYAIDRRAGSVAAGTKAGAVHYLPCDGRESDLTIEQEARNLWPPSAVLAVCNVNMAVVAASDTSGRCTLYRFSGDDRADDIETGGRLFCSLCLTSTGLLAGLSTEGHVIMWDLSGRTAVKEIRGPVPPSLGALVHMVEWQEQRALVYPGRNGELACVGLDGGRVTTLMAHEGEWYGLDVFPGGLVTVGRQDGTLKIWQPGLHGSCRKIRCPEGVTSAAVLDETVSRVLLVLRGGDASLYETSNDRLRLLADLPGRDYRVAAGPDLYQVRTARIQETDRRAHVLARQIAERIEMHDTAEIGPLHVELGGLGYDHVSLALQAKQARNEGALLEELRCRTELHRKISWRDDCCETSLERYAELLETVWQIEEALVVRKKLSAMNPPNAGGTPLKRLVGHAARMRDFDWAAKPELALPLIIAAATMTGKPCRGRWIIRAGASLPCRGATFSPDDIVAKYEEVRSRSAEGGLPQASEAKLWLLTEKDCSREQVVLFATGAPGIELVFDLSHDGIQVVVVPLIVLFAGDAETDRPAEEHNERLQRALLEGGGISGVITSRLNNVYQAGLQAIRQIVTKSRASRYGKAFS